MNYLILDTSTNYLVVGLLKNGKESIVTREGNNDNSAYITNKIKEVLDKNDLSINDINEIIVGVGPGSYTGIRVSVVAAKTLAYTKNIKLKEISSLAFLSSGYDNEVYASIDARRNFVFSGKYLKAKELEKDTYISLDKIDKDKLVLLNKDTIKININNIINNAKEVKDVHLLEPKYLRKTEAERNL